MIRGVAQGSYPYEQRDFSGSAELYTVEYRLFSILLALEMPLPWSFFDKFGYMCQDPCHAPENSGVDPTQQVGWDTRWSS